MKVLFLKIFSLFWIAQSLIAIASTVLILSQRAPDGGASVRSLRDGLQIEAAVAVRVYREGGCSALLQFGEAHHQAVSLLTSQRVDPCTPSTPAAVHEEMPIGNGVYGHTEGERYLWRVPVLGSVDEITSVQIAVPRSGRGASLLHDIRDFGFPQLLIILAVGGATTFLLVLWMTRPLSLLSAGAKAMASGNLNARVPHNKLRAHRAEDAFQQLIRDFNRMAERLETLVEAHKLLLRDVSHELRSPLTRLNVALGLARKHTPQSADSYLNRIEQEADRVNEMIGQLLTLSSMEVSTPESWHRLSVRELIQALLPDARFEASLAGCTITVLQKEDYWVYGQRELLLRALENVIRNAIHYTDPDSEIVIAAFTEPDPPTVHIQVSDCGPGIPEKDLHAVFLPFFRTDRSRSSSSGGFGVGLAIAKRAIELHHGAISASNLPQGGASLILRLPVDQEPASQPRSDPVSTESAHPVGNDK